MFDLLDSLPKLSIVSVGHRPSLLEFHDKKLKLSSHGYTLENTGSERKAGMLGEEHAGVEDSSATSTLEPRGRVR